MARLVEMPSGMPARRAVAAADVATPQAKAQVDPARACLQTFFTPRSTGRSRTDAGQVFANHSAPYKKARLSGKFDSAMTIKKTSRALSQTVGLNKVPRDFHFGALFDCHLVV
jgi:hypothetical protein